MPSESRDLTYLPLVILRRYSALTALSSSASLAEKKILVIHGPNLNLLGEREPGVYGTDTFESINREISEYCKSLGFECEIFQSNHEGEIIDKLHDARKCFDGVVINAGAYTHYSYAIRDAIAAIRIPVIEVHMSDIHKREAFRAVSVIEPVCRRQICGFGKKSYLMGVDALKEILADD